MKFLQLIILLSSMMVFSQQFTLNGKIAATAIVSSENEIPFWFYTNSNFSIAELTNTSITGEITTKLKFSSLNIIAGTAIYGRDGVEDAVQRRDLYIQFENPWLFATVGSKKEAEVLDGLSATNQNFLLSGNARPLPGIILEANNPIKISNTFAVDWAIAHYVLNDKRYVKSPNLHHKKLAFIATFNEKHKLTAKIQHYVQWGGTSPEYGKLKDGFNDFFKIFFASKYKEIGLEGEIQNAIGNHLGSYMLNYEYKNRWGQFSVYHEHPFEDGSGTRLANFPDGVWGAFFMPKNQKIISSILYEYIDTMDQSGVSISGRDHYFRNAIYRSGWTYEKNIIGSPFILYNKNLPLDVNSSRFLSNRSKTHHLGIAGGFKKFQWKFKSTLAKYFGTYTRPFKPEWKYWYTYGSLSYKVEKLGTFTILGGVDVSNVSKTIIGGGIQYSYSF